jgi:hypothetical protein
MITVEVYIMFINNKNNWMTTYFVGMTVWHRTVTDISDMSDWSYNWS